MGQEKSTIITVKVQQASSNGDLYRAQDLNTHSGHKEMNLGSSGNTNECKGKMAKRPLIKIKTLAMN